MQADKLATVETSARGSETGYMSEDDIWPTPLMLGSIGLYERPLRRPRRKKAAFGYKFVETEKKGRRRDARRVK